jgi:hypothetical protein
MLIRSWAEVKARFDYAHTAYAKIFTAKIFAGQALKVSFCGE